MTEKREMVEQEAKELMLLPLEISPSNKRNSPINRNISRKNSPFRGTSSPRRLDSQNSDTFLTGINIKKGAKSILAENPDIIDLHNQLKDTVCDLDVKINRVLQKQEYEYLKAYEIFVQQKEKEIQDLNEKVKDVDPDKKERSKKITDLQVQIQNLRLQMQAMDLNNKRLNKQMIMWKTKANNAKEDNIFLERQVKDHIKQNRVLNVILNKIQGLMSKPEIRKILSLITSNASQNNLLSREDQSEGQRSTSKAELSLNVNSPEKQILQMLEKAGEIASHSPDLVEPGRILEEIAGSDILTSYDGTQELSKSTPYPDQLKSNRSQNNQSKIKKSTPFKHRKISDFVNEVFKKGESDKESIKQELVDYLEGLEVNYLYKNTTLHKKIEKEKKKTLKFKSMKPNQISEKSDLESLFLDCIEEMRKQIAKRKVRNQILFKKEFKSHLNKIIKGKHGISENPSGKASTKFTENEEKKIEDVLNKLSYFYKGKIKYEDFNATDKSALLEQFVLNEQTLLKFYEIIFPPRQNAYEEVNSKLDEVHMESLTSDRIHLHKDYFSKNNRGKNPNILEHILELPSVKTKTAPSSNPSASFKQSLVSSERFPHKISKMSSFKGQNPNLFYRPQDSAYGIQQVNNISANSSKRYAYQDSGGSNQRQQNSNFGNRSRSLDPRKKQLVSNLSNTAASNLRNSNFLLKNSTGVPQSSSHTIANQFNNPYQNQQKQE